MTSRKMIWFLVAVCLIPFGRLSGQSPEGIDANRLKDLQNSFKIKQDQQALVNAISNNNINDLALNREMVNQHNDIFNVMIKAKGITDQKSSGRCWMYAGLNILRPAMIQKYNVSEFEFSQNYLFFWDKLEKTNYFLETIIETRNKPIDDRELQTLLDGPIGDGGWWTYYTALIEKYGVVPKENMPETANSEKSSMMNKTIEYLILQGASDIREQAASGASVSKLREIKEKTLQQVYKILIYHLGTPPGSFTWRYKDKDDKIHEQQYTPQQFYTDVVGVNLNDYITLFHHPVQDYNKLYQV